MVKLLASVWTRITKKLRQVWDKPRTKLTRETFQQETIKVIAQKLVIKLIELF
jgi:hypothetical protein